MSRPQGGFVLWVELPEGTDSLAIQARALERGIAVAPGPIFSIRSRFQNCLRINAGYPMTARIDRAIATLGELSASSSQRRSS